LCKKKIGNKKIEGSPFYQHFFPTFSLAQVKKLFWRMPLVKRRTNLANGTQIKHRLAKRPEFLALILCQVS